MRIAPTRKRVPGAGFAEPPQVDVGQPRGPFEGGQTLHLGEPGRYGAFHAADDRVRAILADGHDEVGIFDADEDAGKVRRHLHAIPILAIERNRLDALGVEVDEEGADVLVEEAVRGGGVGAEGHDHAALGRHPLALDLHVGNEHRRLMPQDQQERIESGIGEAIGLAFLRRLVDPVPDPFLQVF